MKNNQKLNSILKNVNKIFKEVLENNTIKIKYETTSNDIPEWDSLGHIQLVVAIEKYFHIKFTAAEIQNYKNVEEMCLGIIKKMNK